MDYNKSRRHGRHGYNRGNNFGRNRPDDSMSIREPDRDGMPPNLPMSRQGDMLSSDTDYEMSTQFNPLNPYDSFMQGNVLPLSRQFVDTEVNMEMIQQLNQQSGMEVLMNPLMMMRDDGMLQNRDDIERNIDVPGDDFMLRNRPTLFRGDDIDDVGNQIMRQAEKLEEVERQFESQNNWSSDRWNSGHDQGNRYSDRVKTENSRLPQSWDNGIQGDDRYGNMSGRHVDERDWSDSRRQRFERNSYDRVTDEGLERMRQHRSLLDDSSSQGFMSHRYCQDKDFDNFPKSEADLRPVDLVDETPYQGDESFFQSEQNVEPRDQFGYSENMDRHFRPRTDDLNMTSDVDQTAFGNPAFQRGERFPLGLSERGLGNTISNMDGLGPIDSWVDDGLQNRMLSGFQHCEDGFDNFTTMGTDVNDREDRFLNTRDEEEMGLNNRSRGRSNGKSPTWRQRSPLRSTHRGSIDCSSDKRSSSWRSPGRSADRSSMRSSSQRFPKHFAGHRSSDLSARIPNSSSERRQNNSRDERFRNKSSGGSSASVQESRTMPRDRSSFRSTDGTFQSSDKGSKSEINADTTKKSSTKSGEQEITRGVAQKKVQPSVTSTSRSNDKGMSQKGVHPREDSVIHNRNSATADNSMPDASYSWTNENRNIPKKPASKLQKKAVPIVFKFGMRCPICPNSRQHLKLNDYVNHWQLYHVEFYERYKCPYTGCSSISPTVVCLRKHYKKEHSNGAEPNEKTQYLLNEVKSVRTRNQYYVDPGNFIFDPQNERDEPVPMESGTIVFKSGMKCPVCQKKKKFLEENDFKMHWQLCHIKFTIRYACPEDGCRTKLVCHKYLRIHYWKRHALGPNLTDTEVCMLNSVKGLKTQNTIFVDPGNLRYDCGMRDLDSDVEEDQQSGVMDVELEQPNKIALVFQSGMKCPICLKTRKFEKELALRNHWLLTHVEFHDRYPCPFEGCSAGTAKNLKLKEHYKKLHNDNQPLSEETLSKLERIKCQRTRNIQFVNPGKYTYLHGENVSSAEAMEVEEMEPSDKMVEIVFQSDMSCPICPDTKRKYRKVYDFRNHWLLAHLEFHDRHFCPAAGCSSAYGKILSLKMHYKKCHNSNEELDEATSDMLDAIEKRRIKNIKFVHPQNFTFDYDNEDIRQQELKKRPFAGGVGEEGMKREMQE